MNLYKISRFRKIKFSNFLLKISFELVIIVIFLLYNQSLIETIHLIKTNSPSNVHIYCVLSYNDPINRFYYIF